MAQTLTEMIAQRLVARFQGKKIGEKYPEEVGARQIAAEIAAVNEIREPPMIFFEATNGRVGESYVRRYVWAKDSERAKELVGSDQGPWIIKPLFHDATHEFVTEVSDCGWQVFHEGHSMLPISPAQDPRRR